MEDLRGFVLDKLRSTLQRGFVARMCRTSLGVLKGIALLHGYGYALAFGREEAVEGGS
jgi:hypothetical protein